jgi:hypothetical protein
MSAETEHVKTKRKGQVVTIRKEDDEGNDVVWWMPRMGFFKAVSSP